MSFYSRFFILSLFFLSSCQFFEHEKWRVKLDEIQLTESKIQKHCGRFSGNSDSVSMCNAFIQNWIDRRLIEKEALQNIDYTEIEQTIAENKIDITLSQFYKNVLQKELEASISEEEVQQFYEKNNFLFKITQPIVQIFVISRFKNDIEALKNINILFLQLPKMNIEDVGSFLIAHQIDGNLHHISSRFEFLSDLKNLFPFLNQTGEKKLSKNNQFVYPDEENVYHVHIFDCQEKGILPFHLAKKKIKLSILAQKKENYLSELTLKLRNKAIASGNLKYN